MKNIKKLSFLICVFILSDCSPYDAFEMSSGKMTVQETKGYNSDNGYIAVTSDSKHYQFSNSYYSALYDGKMYGADGNEDGMLNPGETVIYDFKVANYGKKPVYGVNVVISTNDKYVSDMENISGFIGNFTARNYTPDSKTVFFNYDREKNLRFTISENTPSGHIVRFEITFIDTDGNKWQDYFLLTVY